VTHLVTSAASIDAYNRVIARQRTAYLSRDLLCIFVRVSMRLRVYARLSPRISRNSLIYFSYARRRDCPGVGTSSGPAGKEISYHGNVGGTSVGYKPQPQHSPQTRGPPPHFPQESVGPPANSPPLHINICGQVNASSSVAPLPSNEIA